MMDDHGDCTVVHTIKKYEGKCFIRNVVTMAEIHSATDDSLCIERSYVLYL